jgi:hypothetical protein
MKSQIHYVRIAGQFVDILAALGYDNAEMARIGKLIASHVEVKQAQEEEDAGVKVPQNLRN